MRYVTMQSRAECCAVRLQGFLAICAFGLPGRSHEDGPARGIQAAVSIVEALKVHAATMLPQTSNRPHWPKSDDDAP